MIQQAIEEEPGELLAQYENVTMLAGKRVVVRNGYLPEREVLTAVGAVLVKVPRVRDRSGMGVKFNFRRSCLRIAQVAACVGGTAVAVPERHFDRQHE